MIKQINGIVSGQDLKVAELTDQLNAAVSEKQVALEAAKTDMDAANLLKSNVQKEIEDIRKVSQAQIAKAEQERDAAIRERDDARTIAAEKTKNNELLKQQIEGMKIDFDQKLEIAILKAKVEKNNELDDFWTACPKEISFTFGLHILHLLFFLLFARCFLKFLFERTLHCKSLSVAEIAHGQFFYVRSVVFRL